MKQLVKSLCLLALLVLAAFDLIACKQVPPKAPCAAGIVAVYTAEMVAAGCTGEVGFYAEKCEPIKAKRDRAEREAGCL